jgi:hypothetical protein
MPGGSRSGRRALRRASGPAPRSGASSAWPGRCSSSGPGGSGHLPARLVGGVIAVVGLVQGIVDATRGTYALFGVRIAPILDQPLRSVTVREFWGRRWNRTVADWLRHHAFAPLARAGAPGAGVVASFGLSALFHAYIVLVPLGPGPAAMMASFFLAQIPIVFVERRFLSGPPRAVKRLAAIALLLGSSPLFTLPFTAVLLGPDGSSGG